MSIPSVTESHTVTESPAVTESPTETDLRTGLEIAVIGMAGKFPGANNIDEFWHNLQNGIEGISTFTDAELMAEGVAEELLKNPAYVKANGLLDNPYLFDANFFGYPVREAELLDPQLRIMHECAWETLENAGYDAAVSDLAIGMYSGATDNLLWLRQVFQMVESNPGDLFEAESLIKRDYFATRLAYKLGLTGPALNVQTACSTSLVAIHMAVQGLLSGDCDMAMAGGVSVQSKKEGYLYQEGMIGSPDGHCRTFDAKAKGTVGGEGVGLVLLKRLDDAEADGDQILAVIKGSAINNDGLQKVGFTAPSVEGQRQVISAALEAAEVAPENIAYVECHGTGTPLGDPIEIGALSQVFSKEEYPDSHLYLGAVKTNIGHLDAAAGVSGFIKTVLSLQHQYLPPTLHFQAGNPTIDWAATPFEVIAKGQSWSDQKGIRRAGVSSFGIGGTNAHVVLEEYLDERESGPSREWQLLTLSARSQNALSQVSEQLTDYLADNQEQHSFNENALADISYTLQTGRRHWDYRQVALCQDVKEGIATLKGENPQRLLAGVGEAPAITFMFSGQGSQYLGMASGLYQTESVFKAHVDECLEQLPEALSTSLHTLLFGASNDANRLNDTAITQPALFVVEYALAQQLQHWGIYADAMIGHSLGEYVAATLSGVLSLEDALKLVTARGCLMGAAEPGGMLSVALSADVVISKLPEGLSLAADNSSELSVVSGSLNRIDSFADALAEEDIKHSKLHTSHAYHSEMMAPILDDFREVLHGVALNPPTQPYISNVTGDWIRAEEAQDVEYWCRHLRGTVQFNKGLKTLLADSNRLFLEVGPGRSLCSFVQRHESKVPSQVICNALRHVKDDHNDDYHSAWVLARLHVAGAEVDWAAYREGERRLRKCLPTYPFEHQEFRPGVDHAANMEIAQASLSETQSQPTIQSNRHQRPNLATAFVAPTSDVDQKVAALWCELFRLVEIGIHDDFFELGGNSLLATRLLSKMQAEGFSSVSLDQIFSGKTIAALTDELTDTLSDNLAQSENTQLIVPGCGNELNAVTPMQQKLWMFSQLGDGHTAYHIPLIIDVQGEFDQDAFKATLADIIERHQVLRTTYHNEQGQIRLQLHEQTDVPFQVYDLSAEDEDAFHARINDEIARPFDLERDCMVRAALFMIANPSQLTKQRQALVITQHHIASDGWSVGVLAAEIEALYSAKVNGQEVSLTPLPVQFQDYAHWYQEFSESDTFQQQIDYWRDYLQGAPQLHNLPLDFPRGSQQSFTSERCLQILDPQLSAQLRTFNLAHNTTLFMLLQSVLALVLCRWSNSDDLVMGTPIANRQNPQLEPLIGAFVNTLVLRNQLPADSTFVEYLTQCRQNHLQGFAYQQVPYELLLDELGVIKGNQYNPLYQILFAMQNNERPAINLPGLTLELQDPDLLENVFDLQVNAYEIDDEIQIVWDYNQALFKAETIESILSSFETALRYGITHPDTPLPQIPITAITLAERYQQNFVFADSDVNRERTVIARIIEQAQHSPDQIALEAGNESLTYQALQTQVVALSAKLRQQGIGEGDFVALYLPRTSYLPIALLAVMHAGAAFVPLDPAHPVDRVSAILDQVEVATVLTVSNLTERLKGITDSMLELDVMALDSMPGVSSSKQAPAESILNSDAYILFTSGSTGQPKGVTIAQRALAELMTSFLGHFGVGVNGEASSCRWLAVSTITFDISILEVLAPLCVGGTVIIAQEEEVKDGFALQRKLDECDINILQATPATYKMLLLANWQGKQDLKALSGGEAISMNLVQGMADKCKEFWNGYGPTEATIYCLVKQVDFNAEPGQALSIGGALPNSGYLILDEHLQPVPKGVAGQLFIAGHCLAKGYWQKPELTAEKFVDVGLDKGQAARVYASGDLVRQRSDGDLDYLGRIDHQVKIRGHRIELEEIEAKAAQHAIVKEACALVLTDQEGEGSIVCYLLASENQNDKDEYIEDQLISEVRQYLFKQLPTYMLPSAIVVMNDWPLTANGKIDRNALPKPDFNQISVPMVAPESETEQSICDICKQVLHLEQASMAANFFELGGNSLTATHFVALINDTFELQISIKDFIEQATLTSLAELLEEKVLAAERVKNLLVSEFDSDEELEEFEL